MADLYLSLLGAPFRAAVARAGGERAFVRLGERSDDESALDPVVWLDTEGGTVGATATFMARSGHAGSLHHLHGGDAAAASGDWTARDLLAVVIRKLLDAAVAGGGEGMRRVTCLIAADSSEDDRASYMQAALLAGAPDVTLMTPAQLVLAEVRAGAVGVAFEAWDNNTRITVVDRSAADATTAVIDATPMVSRDGLRTQFFAAAGIIGERRSSTAVEIGDRMFEMWTTGRDLSRGVSLTRPVARGAPLTLFVSAAVFRALDDTVRDAVETLVRSLGHGSAGAAVGVVHVYGSWARPLAKAVRTYLGAGVAIRDEIGLELDAAIRIAPPNARDERPFLAHDILAVAVPDRTVRAMAQGEPVALLRAGSKLPATAVLETFRSNTFIGRFAIAARTDAAFTPLASIDIPRFAERQPTSYLRVVVHCDTERYMLLEVAYLYSTKRRFTFYDRHLDREIAIADRIFRVVRA